MCSRKTDGAICARLHWPKRPVGVSGSWYCGQRGRKIEIGIRIGFLDEGVF